MHHVTTCSHDYVEQILSAMTSEELTEQTDEPSAILRSEAVHLIAPGPARGLYTLVDPVIEDLGYRLVRVRMTGDGTTPVLQIMAERPDGMLGIDDCEKISVALSASLDVEDPITGNYTLEVSSPGMARPLTRAEHFEQWSGSEARIELLDAVDGQKRFRGRLAGFAEGEALLEVVLEGYDSPQILGFALEQIAEARLIIEEDMLKSALKAGKPARRAGK